MSKSCHFVIYNQLLCFANTKFYSEQLAKLNNMDLTVP